MTAGSDLDAAVAAALQERGWDLAVAESCTGGLLGGRITALAGSSDYFVGGVIAYSNLLKVSLLTVPPGLITTFGAVSREVAQAMADGVLGLTGARVGLAVTGVAGPSGSEQKPPGLVFIAITCPLGRQCLELVLSGSRAGVREQAVEGALRLLLRWAGEGS